MKDLVKPRVVISKCIEFEPCRWNGLKISSWMVKLLKPHLEFVPICPEVQIGLGVPREPLRIILLDQERRMVESGSGIDLTDKILEFSEKFLSSLGEVDGFILKERSPSCGVKNVKIYPRAGKVAPLNSKNPGFFGEAIITRFPGLPIEDEGRLNNFKIREHFLIRIFAGAKLRQVINHGKFKDLIDFHSSHKLTLMAYNQVKMRLLGSLIANHAKLPQDHIFPKYQALLLSALEKPPSPGAVINVLMHAQGYFKDKLSAREKSFFLGILEEYRQRRVPMGVPVAVIRSWIVRFQQPYLSQQSFFSPYPEDLIEVTDSGKGREIWR